MLERSAAAIGVREGCKRQSTHRLSVTPSRRQPTRHPPSRAPKRRGSSAAACRRSAGGTPSAERDPRPSAQSPAHSPHLAVQ